MLDDLSVKLTIANALLFKIRKYVSPKILSPSALLFSNPTYLTALLSGLRILELLNRLEFYKKKLLESLISNQGISILVPYLNITLLKKFKIKCLENILFVSRSINKLTPSVFNT